MASGANQLRDLWVAAPDELYAVGDTGSSAIFHYHAGSWGTPEMSSTNIPGTLAGVWGRSATDVFAVGQLAATHRTTTWTTISSGAIGEAVAVWGDASTVYAVGSQVVAYDGSSWTSITNAEHVYSGVWVAPSGKVWLSATDGVGHLSGTDVAYDVPQGHYNAIWGASETDVFAVGVGTVQHGADVGFTAMTIPTTATLTGVWGRSADDVFAVGVGSTVLHLHAGIWKQFTTPFSGGSRGGQRLGSLDLHGRERRQHVPAARHRSLEGRRDVEDVLLRVRAREATFERRVDVAELLAEVDDREAGRIATDRDVHHRLSLTNRHAVEARHRGEPTQT